MKTFAGYVAWFAAMAVLGLFVGMLTGCGGGSPDDPDSPERNTLPVGCLSAGCAK